MCQGFAQIGQNGVFKEYLEEIGSFKSIIVHSAQNGTKARVFRIGLQPPCVQDETGSEEHKTVDTTEIVLPTVKYIDYIASNPSNPV